MKHLIFGTMLIMLSTTLFSSSLEDNGAGSFQPGEKFDIGYRKRDADFLRNYSSENLQVLLREDVRQGSEKLVEATLTIIKDQEDGQKKVEELINSSHVLHIAAETFNIPMVKLLLCWNAHPTDKDNNNRTPLERAIQSKVEDSACCPTKMQDLIRILAPYEDKKTGNAILAAIYSTNTHAVELLLKAGIKADNRVISTSSRTFSFWEAHEIPVLLYVADQLHDCCSTDSEYYHLLKMLLSRMVYPKLEYKKWTARLLIERAINRWDIADTELRCMSFSCAAARVKEEILPLLDKVEQRVNLANKFGHFDMRMGISENPDHYDDDFPIYNPEIKYLASKRRLAKK